VIDPPSDQSRSDPADEQPAPPRQPRKNLMLAASIEAGGLRAPVRIRNLSEGGAMLDGAALPDVGATLVLHRAEIDVGATVVWREAGRCGIRFNNVVASVDEWVAGKCAPTFHGQHGQARVDAIQSAVRAGAALPSEPGAATGAGLSASELERRLGEEIDFVRRLIDGLGEELSEDAGIVHRHLGALQNLDRASQVLEHIGAILSAPDRIAAAQSVTMQELRERLLRKPISGA